MLVRSAYSPEHPIDQSVVAGDADRDLGRRSSMLTSRISASFQRTPIGGSTAGLPRTYRVVRSLPWARHRAGRLRRLMAGLSAIASR